jgi:hypothetical protein
MLPFKVYIVPAFVVAALVVSFATSSDAETGFDWPKGILVAIVYGYLVCIVALLVGVLVAGLFTRDYKAMWSAFGYAALGFVILGFLWVQAFPPPTK